MDVKPFEGYDFGADVTGLDLDAPVDSAVVDNLRCALDEYQLLVFRNEAIPSPEAQISLVGTFGPVGDELGDGRRWSTVASDVREMVRPRHRLLFHSDYSFCQWPFPVISLCTLVVQGDVVPTKFSSARGAYERLQPDLRKAVKDLSAVHYRDARPSVNDDPLFRIPIRDKDATIPRSAFQTTAHPVVMAHPRTGRLQLFVNEGLTSHIVGMDDARGEDILQELFTILYSDNHIYEHRYSDGDVVVWDNVAMQHARDQERPNSQRRLRRVTVLERPIAECQQF